MTQKILPKKRLVTYVDDNLIALIKKEAKKLGMTESTFVRFMLLKHLKKGA